VAGVANGLNQLTSVGGVSASYDTKGNLTAEPISGKTYGYSSENLLTSGNGSVTAAYDPLTRLTQIVGAATTKFAYDGVDSLAEYDGAGALQRRFVFDPTTGQPVVQYEGTGVAATDRRYLSQDERGSVISTADSAGTLIGINTYDEFGVPGAANVGRFQYTGQAWLSDLGLNYYKARMYAPQLGRFAQPDPMGYGGGGPNLYNYVLGDPVNLVDPLGLEIKCVTVEGGQTKCSFVPDTGFAGSELGSFGVGGAFDLGAYIANIENPIYVIAKRIRQRTGSILDLIQRPWKPSACTGPVASWMSSAYKGGALAAKAGQGAVILGAVVEAGDVTPAAPVTAPGGLGLIAFGTLGITVGTSAQASAGLYYAAHGNFDPLANAVASFTFGLVHGPNPVAHEAMANAIEGEAQAAERGHDPVCRPME
jgi:RHS repeat-associated protein